MRVIGNGAAATILTAASPLHLKKRRPLREIKSMNQLRFVAFLNSFFSLRSVILRRDPATCLSGVVVGSSNKTTTIEEEEKAPKMEQ